MLTQLNLKDEAWDTWETPMRSLVFKAMVVCAALGLSAAAFSQDRDRPSTRRELTQAQAVQIARGYGMVEVEEVEREDGVWEIEGRDRRGREVEIRINRDGRVTRVERRRDSSQEND